jgi:hypothetical protein
MRSSDEVMDLVRGIERRLGAGVTHHEIGEALNDELSLNPTTDRDADPLVWEVWLFGLMLTDPGSYREQWGPLAPMAVFPPNVYPPPVDYFPDAALDHFDRRLAESNISSSLARLADVLWIRRRSVEYADRAIEAYLEAATMVLAAPLGPTTALDYLQRALDLIRSLGRADDMAADAVFEIVDQFIAEEDWGLVCASIRLSHRILALRSDPAHRVLSTVVDAANHFGSAGGQERFRERDLFEVAADLARDLDDGERADELRRFVPRSLEQEAAERADEGGLIESALLEDALRGFSNLGMSEDLTRVKRALHLATQRAVNEMTEVRAEFNVPTADFEREVDRLLEASRPYSAWHHLYEMARSRGLWPSWDDVERQQQELAQRFPIQSLVRKEIVTADGRTLPRPTDEAAAKEFDAVGRFTQDQHIYLGLQLVRVQLLREREAWSRDLLLRALSESNLYTEPMLRAVEPGLAAFEEDRPWDALHILTPQVERVIRRIGQLRGAETLRYNAGKGQLLWSSLEQMLDDPAIAGVLNTIRPSLSHELKFSFVDSRGWNIRNAVAHGITTPDEDMNAMGLLLIFVLLCFATLRVEEAEA